MNSNTAEEFQYKTDRMAEGIEISVIGRSYPGGVLIWVTLVGEAKPRWQLISPVR